MADLVIPDIDQALAERLQARARQHGRSPADEAREILDAALPARLAAEETLDVLIRRRFAPFGGVELQLPPREIGREPPDFSGPEYGA